MAEVSANGSVKEAWTVEANVVGLDKDGIGLVKESLNKYVTSIKTAINDLSSDEAKANISLGIKGENSQQKVLNSIKGIGEKCASLLDNLKKFETALDNLEASYAANDANGGVNENGGI